MKKITKKQYKYFDDIKHIDENGMEFWYARELAEVLDYAEWRNFLKVIKRSMIACDNSGNNTLDHFVEVDKMVEIGSKTKRKIKDYELTRYACYLIMQNGDPRKEIIALGQTYFAVQTYGQEVEVGRKVRKAIKNIGGTMPEDLPTPQRSIQAIEREHMRRLKNKARNNKLILDE